MCVLGSMQIRRFTKKGYCSSFGKKSSGDSVPVGEKPCLTLPLVMMTCLKRVKMGFITRPGSQHNSFRTACEDRKPVPCLALERKGGSTSV